MKTVLIALLSFYKKFISPFMPRSCRFYPTCADYSKEAIIKYGAARGAVKSIKRICKCHPFHPGGYDPVE